MHGYINKVIWWVQDNSLTQGFSRLIVCLLKIAKLWELHSHNPLNTKMEVCTCQLHKDCTVGGLTPTGISRTALQKNQTRLFSTCKGRYHFHFNGQWTQQHTGRSDSKGLEQYSTEGKVQSTFLNITLKLQNRLIVSYEHCKYGAHVRMLDLPLIPRLKLWKQRRPTAMRLGQVGTVVPSMWVIVNQSHFLEDRKQDILQFSLLQNNNKQSKKIIPPPFPVCGLVSNPFLYGFCILYFSTCCYYKLRCLATHSPSTLIYS